MTNHYDCGNDHDDDDELNVDETTTESMGSSTCIQLADGERWCYLSGMRRV